MFVGCFTSQQHASISHGLICTDNFTCCHTEIGVADQTFHLTQSQYTDTGPTSPSTDPIPPSAWQCSHWSANFLSHWCDSTTEKSRRKRDSKPGSSALVVDALTTRPTRRCQAVSWQGAPFPGHARNCTQARESLSSPFPPPLPSVTNALPIIIKHAIPAVAVITIMITTTAVIISTNKKTVVIIITIAAVSTTVVITTTTVTTTVITITITATTAIINTYATFVVIIINNNIIITYATLVVFIINNNKLLLLLSSSSLRSS